MGSPLMVRLYFSQLCDPRWRGPFRSCLPLRRISLKLRLMLMINKSVVILPVDSYLLPVFTHIHFVTYGDRKILRNLLRLAFVIQFLHVTSSMFSAELSSNYFNSPARKFRTFFSLMLIWLYLQNKLWRSDLKFLNKLKTTCFCSVWL